jgi:hypothetical protein
LRRRGTPVVNRAVPRRKLGTKCRHREWQTLVLTRKPVELNVQNRTQSRLIQWAACHFRY